MAWQLLSPRVPAQPVPQNPEIRSGQARDPPPAPQELPDKAQIEPSGTSGPPNPQEPPSGSLLFPDWEKHQCLTQPKAKHQLLSSPY